MIKGTTASGFEFEVDPNVFDDWMLLKKIRAIDNGNGQLAVDVAQTILGDEQLDRLENHVAKKNGKVRVTDIMVELEKIFEACDSGKN